MRWLLDSANRYLRECTWQDLALVKLCLFSLRLLAGTSICSKGRRPVRLMALGTFLLTYVPLMIRFFHIASSKEERCS